MAERSRRTDRRRDGRCVLGGSRTLPASLMVIIRLANSANEWRLRTCGRLYLCDTILQRLPQDLEHMACALRPLVEAQDAVVRP